MYEWMRVLGASGSAIYSILMCSRYAAIVIGSPAEVGDLAFWIAGAIVGLSAGVAMLVWYGIDDLVELLR